MAGSCSAPRPVAVKSHSRAKVRKKPKPKKGVAYWIVRNERTGQTTGIKHRTYSSAIAARKREDLRSYRAGRGRPWNVERRG